MDKRDDIVYESAEHEKVNKDLEGVDISSSGADELFDDIKEEKMDDLIDACTNPNTTEAQHKLMMNNDSKGIKEKYSKDKKEKYVKLYQARAILSAMGTMKERRICFKMLKVMRAEGLKSV